MYAALAEDGILLDGSTNAPRWDGTPVDYGLCVEVLADADRLDQCDRPARWPRHTLTTELR